MLHSVHGHSGRADAIHKPPSFKKVIQVNLADCHSIRVEHRYTSKLPICDDDRALYEKETTYKPRQAHLDADGSIGVRADGTCILYTVSSVPYRRNKVDNVIELTSKQGELRRAG